MDLRNGHSLVQNKNSAVQGTQVLRIATVFPQEYLWVSVFNLQIFLEHDQAQPGDV